MTSTDNPTTPPIAPLYCDECRRPMTEIEPGRWVCIQPASLDMQGLIRSIFGQAVRAIEIPLGDARRHEACPVTFAGKNRRSRTNERKLSCSSD